MNKNVALWVGFFLSCMLVGCGGGSLSSTPSSNQPSTPNPSYNPQTAKYGQWTTSTAKAPINPIHAALLHTGKILFIAGSGNCPPQQAGCPQGPQYAQGAALFDLSNDSMQTLPTNWDMFCNGMSMMQDGRVLIQG